MKLARLMSENNRCRFLPVLPGLLLLLLFAMPAAAKMAIDFNPNLNFSKFKTFAYVGGVEQLVRMQLNPEQLNNQIHRAVTRELTAGLHEVQPQENPDLVVRYWVNSQKEFDVATSTNWGVYGPYFGYHWGFVYHSMDTYSTHQGTLAIELVDAKARDLAWRMFASVKILHTDPDKIWKTADSNIKNAFKGYPPSPKAIETKKKEWANEDAAKRPAQPQS